MSQPEIEDLDFDVPTTATPANTNADAPFSPAAVAARKAASKAALLQKGITPVPQVPDSDAATPAGSSSRRKVTPATLPATNAAGLPPTAAEVMAAWYAKPTPERVLSGVPDLDALLGGGFPVGTVFAICATTAAGKTGLTISLALGAAKGGAPVAIAQMELPDYECSARFSAQLNRQWIRDTIDSRDPETMAATMAALKDKPLYILADRPDLDAIEQRMRAIKAEHPGRTPILILDFLQQMPMPDKGDTRTNVSAAIYDIKPLAESLGMVVIVVSSIGRANYKQNRKMVHPEEWVAYAKESGDIEYAATHLCVLERGSMDPDTREYPGRLIVAKTRHGHPTFIGLRFHGPTGVWRGDPDALDAFTDSAMDEQAAKVSKRDIDDDAAVLTVVRGAGAKGVATSELKTNARRSKLTIGGLTMSRTRSDAALARLVARGQVTIEGRKVPGVGVVDHAVTDTDTPASCVS